MKRLNAKEVADRVIAARAEGGFQLARFSHCEARLMGSELIFPRSEVDRSLRLQLGDDSMSSSELRSISEGVQLAYAATDIAGVTNLISPRAGQEELDELLIAIPRTVAMLSIDQSKKLFCSTDIHLDLLKSGEIDRILSEYDDIKLITCRDISSRLTKKYDKNFSQILIPQEYRTTGLVKDISSGRHYPDVFFEVCREIEENTNPSQLVLIGAGFLGKIYGRLVRERGGVAVDLGSVFDVWCGVESRGFFSSGQFEQFRLPNEGETNDSSLSRTTKPLVPSRKEWVVNDSARSAIWEASTALDGAIVCPADNQGRASAKKNEIFVHSEKMNSNYVEFQCFPDVQAQAVSATLILANKLANATEFVISLTSRSGISVNFSEVCSGDSAVHWLGLLPPNFIVSKLRVSSRPVGARSSQYGWSFFRGLRLY